MEEDIKILENFIKQLEEYEDEQELKQAIENLIKGYKKLQEYSDDLLSQNEMYKDYYDCESIPKSKVIEKIKKLEAERKRKDEEDEINPFYDQIDITHIIEVLEELLQEGDDK